MAQLFHHKGISRLQAEKLLKVQDKDGSYLVRDSETVAGAYTLCVWYKAVVHQYRILPDKEKRLYIQANEGVPEKKFTNIEQLIQQYIQRGENNGLVCSLKHPVGMEKEDDKDSDDEDDVDPDYKDPETSGSCFTLPAKDDVLTNHFHQRFSQLDLSSVDGGFIEDVKQYINGGLQKDATAIQCGTGVTGLREIHQLLAKAAQPLEKQLQEFLGKVELCQHLFGQGKTKKTKEHTYQNDLGQIINRLACCSTEISSLDKKAVKCLQELATISVTSSTADENEMKSIVVNPPRRRPIPPATFTVKAVKGMHFKEVSITLDLNGGKLIIVNPNQSLLDQECMPTHDKIEQLIKNKDNNLRLDVKIEGRKMETYQFEDVKARENFCQLIHQMKNIHAPGDQVDAITVFIGTWNMGDEQPGFNLNAWLKCSGTGRSLDKSLGAVAHDVYVIGTQESSLTEKEWTSKIRKTLQALFEIDLHMIATTSLWGIRLIILTKMEHKNKISHVQTSFVRTGIANTLGNKGAVGVSFSFLATSLCFVCAHLTSGAEKNNRRNSNFRDITKGLSLGNKQLNLFDMTKQFHHLFWLGDLNYRVDEKVDVILKKIKYADYDSLLLCDQLNRSKNKSEAFQYFCEEPITFPPTYRYEKGTRDQYAWKKIKKTGVRINVPSWCDRVLWKSYPDTYVNSRAYGCNEDFISSDHKPVFASFEIGIASQFSSIETQEDDAEIVFENCEAELNTTSRQNYVLEFHSTCLEAPVSSKANLQFGPPPPNCYVPKWTKDMCPPLKPIVPDRNYLEDQHILVAVKSVDVHESYGECVIAVKPYFSVFPVPFECILTHQAEETGVFRGHLHVKVPEIGPAASRWSRRSRKSYEVTMDENDSRRFSTDCCEQSSNLRDRPPAPVPRGALSYNGYTATSGFLHSNLYPVTPITNPTSLGLAKSNLKQGPVPEPRHRKPSPVQRSPATTPEKSPESCPVGNFVPLSPTSDKPPPLMPKDASLKNVRIYDDVPEEVEVPPPPPKRIQSLEMDTYTKIAKPKNIEEWLNQIQFPQYIRTFKQNGWDSLVFLCDLTDDDLQCLKVEKTHRQRILDSIVELNK